ncbi:MAG: tRNA 2-thiocytidine biosynthesis protein TtcA [Clostridia bacterium]|nr:tRNA 2-thiocytidine biosynthesis protein TtcA [Clostridia bacterium]
MDSKESLKQLLSLTRKAVQDYDLIKDGDSVCVGVSGGKDSMALLTVLASLKRFYPKKFDLKAITVSLGFDGVDMSPVTKYCEELGIEHIIVDSHIKEIVFDIRKEQNPCALCANLRRGALNDHARKNGCNVVALAHHYDDVIETALLSLHYEGRFYCFPPETYLERSEVTVIRPFLYVKEYILSHYASLDVFPTVHNPCPMDKTSKRAEIKALIKTLEKDNNMIKTNIFGAVKRGIWPEISGK